MNNRFVSLCLILLLVPITLLAQEDSDEALKTLQVPKPQRHVRVSVIHARPSSAAINIDVRGIVEAGKKIVLNAQSDGIFHQKAAQDTFVKKGQLIGILTDPIRTNKLQFLKRRISLLKTDLMIEDQKVKNSQEMLKLGIISQDGFLTQQSIQQSKKILLLQTQDEMRNLMLSQSKAKIYAPSNGYITSLSADGSYLAYGAKVASLTSDEQRVRLFVDPQYISSLRIGQDVKLITPDKDIDAKISAILPQSSDNLIEVIAKPASRLALSLNIKAKLRMRNIKGWIIPKECIVLEQNRPAVFIIKDEVAHLRFIKIQKDMINNVLIQGTFHPSDQIAAQNAYMLRNRSIVEVIKREK